MEQRRSCRSRNTTTISNCCEKRASPSLFTGSSQRDQPRGECICLSPVCELARAPARFRVFFSTKIFVPKRLRKNKRRGLGANISKRWLRERGLARMEILFLPCSETVPCKNSFLSAARGIFCRLATLVVGFKCSRNHSQPAAYFIQYSYFTLPCGNGKIIKGFYFTGPQYLCMSKHLLL